MGYLKVGLKSAWNGVRSLFGRSAAKTASAVANDDLAKALARKRTNSYYDASTGISTNVGEFNTTTKDGSAYLHMIKSESQTLPDGVKVTRTHVWGKSPNGHYHFGFGGDTYDRTKTIEILEDNLFGGRTIKINKNYANTFGDAGRNETFTKFYDADGVLQRKELAIDYTNGSGYKVRATQDREGVNLTSSAADMLEEPITHTTYKHELSTQSGGQSYPQTRSNHGNFSSKSTLYSRTIAQQEATEKAAKEAAEAAERATAQAAEEAAKKLAASRPRINVSKALGLNIEDLKVVEKIQPNGGVKRYYFRPETGVGKRQPVITTYDHGSLHQEWIRNGKQELIYMKQVGNNEPYVLVKNGNSTQVRCLDDGPDRDVEFPSGYTYQHRGSSYARNNQYVTDGKSTISVERYHANPTEPFAADGVIKVPNYEYDTFVTINGPEQTPKELPFFIRTWENNRGRYGFGFSDTKSFKEAQRVRKDLEKSAKDNYIDIPGLFKPYEQ